MVAELIVTRLDHIEYIGRGPLWLLGECRLGQAVSPARYCLNVNLVVIGMGVVFRYRDYRERMERRDLSAVVSSWDAPKW